jgi:hypothetical protein
MGHCGIAISGRWKARLDIDCDFRISHFHTSCVVIISLHSRVLREGSVVNLESKTDLQKEDSGAAFIPGVGCTVNSRLDMNNIRSTHGSQYDTAGLHRSKDPGVTGFSPYHSSQTVVTLPVSAGDELFAQYGDNWIPWIPGAIITFDQNLEDADEFLREYHNWIKSNDIPEELANGLWNLTSREFPYDSRILGALPQQNWTTVLRQIERHADGGEDSIVRHFIRNIGHRDVDWLKKEGKCQDHLRPGRSTIQQAGRGAFANRRLPKGTVVGYAPLVHIGKARPTLLNITYNESGRVYHNEDLIINYSFGHRDSSLTLTPYGAMVNYINHDRDRANVKVQWPNHELVAHKPDWLTKDIDFLSYTEDKIGLSFDYVALRDIEEGEEIFMDYGAEWEDAWNEYVRKWKPPVGADEYIHATEWKEPLLTQEEQQTRPYPSNLHTLCVPNYILDNNGGYQFAPPVSSTSERVHCQVINRDPSGLSYDVTMLVGDEEVFVRSVTSDGIELVDKARTADWHLPNAFRHEIMIPDDIFPEAWRNKK